MQTERVSPKLSWCAPQRLRRIDGCAQVQECKQDTENWGRKARAVLKQMVIEKTICLSSTLSTATYKLTCNQEAQTAQEAQLANALGEGNHQSTEELDDVLAELEAQVTDGELHETLSDDEGSPPIWLLGPIHVSLSLSLTHFVCDCQSLSLSLAVCVCVPHSLAVCVCVSLTRCVCVLLSESIRAYSIRAQSDSRGVVRGHFVQFGVLIGAPDLFGQLDGLGGGANLDELTDDLPTYLANFGQEFDQCPHDGHCQFHALSRQLSRVGAPPSCSDSAG